VGGSCPIDNLPMRESPKKKGGKAEVFRLGSDSCTQREGRAAAKEAGGAKERRSRGDGEEGRSPSKLFV